MDSTSDNGYSGVTPNTVTLKPRPGGRQLDPNEVIRGVKMACANAAYAYVETSSEGAREKALEWMNQPAVNEDLAHREEFAEDALFVHFGDDLASEGALLSMLVIPRQPLLIEYSSQAPRDGTRALIARCARILGYEIAEQPETIAEQPAAMVERPDTIESVAPRPQRSAPRAASMWQASARFVARFAAGCLILVVAI